jgi:hypothetical protein
VINSSSNRPSSDLYMASSSPSALPRLVRQVYTYIISAIIFRYHNSFDGHLSASYVRRQYFSCSMFTPRTHGQFTLNLIHLIQRSAGNNKLQPVLSILLLIFWGNNPESDADGSGCVPALTVTRLQMRKVVQ